jgi:AraC family transcriptional regulator of adaptative response / methylphosphotriester-DNA alkyltransferase methyltransferase
MDRDAHQGGEAAAPLTDDAKWAAVVACDRAFDRRFYYGVVTTGVFCRPSCRARTPRRENVRFFASAGEAEERGFRPCKRCRPDLPDHDPALSLVRAAEDLLRADGSFPPAPPAVSTPGFPAAGPARSCVSPLSQDGIAERPGAATLSPASLAASLGVSPLGLRRAFKAVLATTPARRIAGLKIAKAARLLLETDAPIAQIGLECGFESLSSFYKHFKQHLGTSPASLRAKGGKKP